MHFMYNFLGLEGVNSAISVTGKSGNKLVLGVPSYSLNKTLVLREDSI